LAINSPDGQFHSAKVREPHAAEAECGIIIATPAIMILNRYFFISLSFGFSFCVKSSTNRDSIFEFLRQG
jgi:hypothetical protein